jgi:hypothetical protein
MPPENPHYSPLFPIIGGRAEGEGVPKASADLARYQVAPLLDLRAAMMAVAGIGLVGRRHACMSALLTGLVK